MVLTTPALLSFMIEEREKYDPYDINPSMIVMDEFDILLSNPGLKDKSLQIIRKFFGAKDPVFEKFNRHR